MITSIVIDISNINLTESLSEQGTKQSYSSLFFETLYCLINKLVSCK